MSLSLHVVSFDVPFPADYGGVQDVFYKVKVLSELGVKIHLHCFAYGRKQAPELESLCESVHYYERNTGHKGLSINLPYIVSSRINQQLINTLREDNHP